MKAITKYKADDGREFLSDTACLEYEKQCEEVGSIINKLPAKPELPACGFSNGEGFLQHDVELLGKVRLELLEFASRFIDNKWITDSIEKGDEVHPSWAGRIINECGIRPLRSAWHRFMCIDKDLREWGQPYYAMNPTEGKQVQLN